MAEESGDAANVAIAQALQAVKESEKEVTEWNTHVKLNLSNQELLSVVISERDKANERLKEANERLKEANERLKEAREYHLRLTETVQTVKKVKIIFQEWESVDPVSNQPFKVDAHEFTLSEKRANAIVQTNKLNHFFQQYGEFPSNYFIRQEEKQLWEIMMTRIHSTCTVIVGSPGVGKSSFLMMLSFHVALHMKQSVLIIRYAKGEGWVYLYIEESGFCRGRCDASNISDIRANFVGAWIFLDGFNDIDVNHTYSSILRPFRVLATSCQYDNKNDDPAELVVLPAWQLKDLQAYAEVTKWVIDVKLRTRKHAKFLPMLVKLQYFYSGGSMRDFRREHALCLSRCFSLVRRTSPHQNILLISNFGQECSQQVDRIRRHFIEDTSNREHYEKSWHWQTLVDSGWVMRWMQVNRNVKDIYESISSQKLLPVGSMALPLSVCSTVQFSIQ
jgi:hypothetical protein